MRKIEIISIVTFLVISALSLYKLNTKRIVPSEFLLRNVEALANNEYGEDPSVIYAWSKLIDCDGWGTGDYKVCQKNGPGNTCYNPGDTTCDCGRNCD